MTASRIVLDTSAYSHLKRGHEQVRDWIVRAPLVHVPSIVLGELEAGFQRGRRVAENRKGLAAFLAQQYVSVLVVDEEVAAAYGRVLTQLRAAGTPIPTNDLWIAATTLAIGAHLITFDRHFEGVEGLSVSVLE